MLAEKKQIEKGKVLVDAQNKALSSVLSQRQLNEQQLYQYTRRLETAIREHTVFPQVQKRVNDLKEEEAKDATVLETQEQQMQRISKLDDYERQLQVRHLESQALETELKEAQDLIKTKDSELQRIYKLLQEK